MFGMTETFPDEKGEPLNSEIRRNSGWPSNFSTEMKAGLDV
jgi:hypothetical protein